ncbi:unnamed protein product [Sphagnum jensenii]|uniref:Uncharacterized protein n=1 Tax=Sphagnum jensenii TaxID=128206 RepID=A0ABP1BBZ5_9BRYO
METKGSRGSGSAEPTDIEHKDEITLLLVPGDKKNSDQSPLRRRGGCHRRATSRIPSLGSEEQRSRQAFSRLVSTHRYLSKLLDRKKKNAPRDAEQKTDLLQRRRGR